MEVARSEQELVRREKLEKIKEYCNPYPEKYEVTNSIKEARELGDGTENVKIAGRIIFMRKMGKLSFLRIRDIEASIQVSMQLDLVGEEAYKFMKTSIDVGDFIGVKGEIVTTQTGEKTLRTHEFEFLGKALKPLPEKFHGLSDQELKYSNRYVDLIMNEDARERFLLRSKLIWEIRSFLNNHGYVEIETPILNNKASGAMAKPFKTHHNALDIDLYLRIAPETYLKRAIIGGFTKVFEFARCFRNEGMDTTHLQDFTMLEGYGAYLNYQDNMKFLQEMIQTVVKNLFGKLELTIDGVTVDISGDWESISMRDLILKYTPIDIYEYDTKEKLLEKIKTEKIEIDSETPLENLGYGNLVDQLYKKVARPHVVKPCFLTKHPISLSHLLVQTMIIQILPIDSN